MAPQLYYITDRHQFPGSAQEQQRRLLEKITECAVAGVDYIQLREKDLSAREMEALSHKAMAALRSSQTKFLINSRTDVALASGAHGVHLPGNDLPVSEVRAVFSRCSVNKPVIGVSAHSAAEVAYAEAHGADFAVFAPVFEKGGVASLAGLDQLRQICRQAAAAVRVFALGGVTLENAALCLEAGAGGIAAIRLFQENAADSVVRALRG